MSYLSETWFVEGNIDFESKKYTLLAYLQRINRAFNEHELYPSLSDLVFHYRNLQQFKENKQLLRSQFPKKLTGIQIRKLKGIYQEMMEDDHLMVEIEDIVQYSLQEIQGTMSTGTEFYDYVESKMTIAPIGILPDSNEEGYFFLFDGTQSIKVYNYRMSIIQRMQDHFRTLRTQFVDEWTRNFVNTYESIKAELLSAKQRMHLPAFYAIETDLAYPIDSTLLPVAKRYLVRHLSSN